MPERSAVWHLADLWEVVADEVPERVAVVCDGRRRTFAEMEERSNRLAHWMLERGVQPGQHVGVYSQNGFEYLEASFAAYKIRAVPINVNFRYVAEELRYLFDDADLVGVVHEAVYGDRIDEIRGDVARLQWTLAIGEEYERALASSSAARDFAARSGDDPYVLYTGGTTGMPKGVVWRQEDAFFACFGGGDPTRQQGDVTSFDDLVARIFPEPIVFLPLAPLMHAAGAWTVTMYHLAGCRVVLLPGALDPLEVWRTVEREGVNSMTAVGDAVLRPLLDAWDELDPKPDISSLVSLGSGGAPLSAAVRERFLATFPAVVLSDGYGSSETGMQAGRRFQGPTTGDVPAFNASQAVVLDEATHEPVVPGSGVIGRVARTGRIPVAYYKDPVKTADTFVEWDGRRWSLTGDMATVEPDGTITLLGRGSQCINTGGEKVFPEEVEGALKAHDGVYDVLVVGPPDDRWGQRVVAVVQPTPGASPTEEQLRAFARERLAGFKVPKKVVFVDAVVRSPSGKADYRWAADVAANA
jgi:3-oxocholest-4-en-26-oate---CoA ligase